jgi:tRNA(Ile)-lysidine synthase
MFLVKKFEEYVHNFLIEHVPALTHQKKICLAVSGGVDSMALLHLFLKLNKYEIFVLHFNHGLRKESLSEELSIRNFCQKMKIQLKVITFNFSMSDKNFEFKARELRQKNYREYIDQGFLVATAHHLNDSFEWSLMQKFKQGNLNSSLGIPVFSNGIIRPFLCTSKEQIIHYAKKEKVFWFEDISNSDNRFERNDVRNNIIPKIKSRFPQYLKHYVHQQNHLAHLLGVHAFDSLKVKYPLESCEHFLTGIVLSSEKLSLYRSEIKLVVEKLSSEKRGKIDIVIDQIFRSHESFKVDPKILKWRGPFSFTGGVKAYLLGDSIYFLNSSEWFLWNKLDNDLLFSIQAKSQIPLLFVNNSSLKYFPNLITNKKVFENFKISKLELPFYQNSLKQLKKSDIPYGFRPLFK